jgi:hypothetical protein
MDIVGLDLHKRASQLASTAPDGTTTDRRIVTSRDRLTAVLDACETGAYRPAHRLADGRRHVRAELAVRDVLVATRTRCASLAKALVRRDGRNRSGVSRLSSVVACRPWTDRAGRKGFQRNNAKDLSGAYQVVAHLASTHG